MNENAARALQYYEDLPRRSGRPELRLVDSEPRTRRRMEAEASTHAEPDARPATDAAGLAEPIAPVEPRRRGEPAPAPSHAPRRARPEHRAAPRRPRPRRQPLTPPRPQAAAPRLAGRPDRVAMWAVILGFFLTAVAAATGHG